MYETCGTVSCTVQTAMEKGQFVAEFSSIIAHLQFLLL